MTTTKTTRRLASLFARFDNYRDMAEEAAAEGAHYDAGFDGGEFSGQAHGRLVARALDARAMQLGFVNADTLDECRRALGMR